MRLITDLVQLLEKLLQSHVDGIDLRCVLGRVAIGASHAECGDDDKSESMPPPWSNHGAAPKWCAVKASHSPPSAPV